MTDVFISFAREDRKRIQKIARALIAEGFEVYVDPKAKSDGEWSAATRRELVNAAVILACWSEEGVQSTWVQAEASHAQDRQALISVSLEKCRVPTQFNRTEITDLSAWRGKGEEPEFENVVRRVRLLLNVQRGLAEQPVLAPSVQLLTPPRPLQQTAQVVAPSAFFTNTLGSRPAPDTPDGRQTGRHEPPRVARPPAPEPATLRPPQPETRPTPRIEPIADPPPPRRVEPVAERRPEPRTELRPEPRPAPRPEPRAPAPPPRVAAEPPSRETPRLLRRDERAAEPPPTAAEIVETPRRGGGALAMSLGLAAAIALLGGGFFFMNQRSNGALGTSLASRLAAPKSEPAEEMAPLTPPLDMAASPPEQSPAEATDLRPRLDQQLPEAAPPAPQTRVAAATPAQTPPPAQARVTPAPPAAAPQTRPPAIPATIPGLLPATVRVPPGRTQPGTTPRAAKLVIPPAGAADAPTGPTGAAAPGGDVVPRMERCLVQLVAYCPRGYGGRGAFAEDGTLSAAERRFMSQRALFGWSEVSEANVENCQRHVQAASRASDSQPYQPLVTACATLPVAGPDR